MRIILKQFFQRTRTLPVLSLLIIAQILMQFERPVFGVLMYAIALLAGVFVFSGDRQEITGKPASKSLINSRQAIILMILITGIAGFLRFHQLNCLPHKLWPDESANVSDVEGILQGRHAVFFPRNNGRESLFIYLIMLSTRIFGTTCFSVRLPGALIGTLTIPLLYPFARRILNRDMAVLACIILACNDWHIIVSHVAYRLILTIPIAILSFLFLLRGTENGSYVPVAVSAVLAGIGIYSYSTFRFVPLMVCLCLLIPMSDSPPVYRRNLKSLLLFLTITGTLSIPMIHYASHHAPEFQKRWQQLSTLRQKNPISTTLDSTVKTALMVNYKGCAYKRYNVPDRPVLPAYLSIFFPPGLYLFCVRLFKRRDHLLVFLLLFFGVLPGMITSPAPWFTRPILALPAIVIMTASAAYFLFIDLVSSLRPNLRVSLFILLCLLVLMIGFIQSYEAVFHVWREAIQPPQHVGLISECTVR